MKKVLIKIKEQLSSQSGKNTLTFLVFLGIATLFWLMMTLNDEVEKDLNLNINITDVPSDITLLADINSVKPISISVKDKGANFLLKKLSTNKTLRIPFNDFIVADNHISINEIQLGSIIRQNLGSTASIVSFKPDSLSIPYTTLPPVKLPINLKQEIHPKAMYTISGSIIVSPDSALLYGKNDRLNTVLETQLLKANGLTDTTKVIVKIDNPKGTRTIPDEVSVTIPIEPLINKTFSIPVDVIKNTTASHVITFPSTVEFSCLVPMSIYNAPPYPIKAYADFSKRNENTIPLEMSILPDNYINGKISLTNVEYIIERE